MAYKTEMSENKWVRVNLKTRVHSSFHQNTHLFSPQHCFILSIRPDNVASLAMARSLGFLEIGAHIDDEDRLELYFERRISRWPEEWRL